MWGNAFLQQAKSDWKVYREIKDLPLDDCHKLYYLRITTEKLGKAALLKGGGYNPENIRKHKLFVKYLQQAHRNPNLCKALKMRPHQVKEYIDGVLSIANSIQNLVPGEGNNGANAEYPWEISGKIYIPASYKFPEAKLLETVEGRKFLNLVKSILENFESAY
ncbi:hypothetical protein HY990_00025 [Candidatus Micrarchaeota archaeon]|nr:hypothetical protein [Candidatus Micrarchaeota archaeon]